MAASPRPGSLFGRILWTYRSEAAVLLALAAAVFVPLSLVEAMGDFAQDFDQSALTDLELGAVAIVAVALVAGALLGEVFYSGAVASIVTGSRTGTRHPLRELVRTLPYGRLIAVDLLLVAGAVLGLLVLIVPGLVFFAYFALAAPIVEIEDRGVRAAFRRSRELVRGRFWTVLGVLLGIVIAIELLTEAADAAGRAALGDSLAADWLVTAVTSVALTPFYAVAAVVLTIELIEAKGGRLPGGSAAP